jgi:hypothetical protein
MNEPGHISESRLTLLICLLLSLLVHLFIVPGVRFHGGRGQADASEDKTAEPFEETVLRSLVPGIQAQTPAKITWIGYEEEIEHLALPEDQDQALMERGGETRAAVGGGAGASSPTPEEIQARAAEWTARLVETAEASQRRVDFLERLLEQASAAVLAHMEQATESQDEVQTPPATETIAEATEEAGAESSQESTEVSDAAGAPSDRDSDAVSDEREIIKVRLGMPIAREGVEIRTTKPKVSVVRRWSSLRARSPLMRLRFRHDGTVDQVTVLESSGYRQVDQDFIDSLYEWTATGTQIEALTASQTLPFIVRLEPI